MKAPVLKRVAHWAKHDLASKNQPLGSSQVHEILAALFGFQSNAAFSQSAVLNAGSPAAAMVVHTQPELALERCRSLGADLDGPLVVRRIRHILDQASTADLMFPSGRETRAVHAFVRRCVLANPRMAGLVDAVESGAAVSAWAANSGPVRVEYAAVDFHADGCRIEASGEYVDAQGTEGSFNLEARFRARDSVNYELGDVALEFRPGEFDELIIDHFTGFGDE
ncbi:hypothetical protein ACOPJQ_08905 [Luteimonas dalianensis]|uniref:hypothetical protein n=1 Tax=Luteimonas dalianensis TaxID=1148196 RepID=UPI003BF3DDE8